MSAVFEAVGDLVEDVFEAVGDVVESVADAVGDVVEFVGDTVQAVLDDPLPTLLSIAGTFVGIPPYVTSAIITGARGGSLQDMVLSAGTSFFAAELGAQFESSSIADSLSTTLLDAGVSSTISDVVTTGFGKGLVGGVVAELRDGEFSDGFAGGFVSTLVNNGVTTLTNFVSDSVINTANVALDSIGTEANTDFLAAYDAGTSTDSVDTTVGSTFTTTVSAFDSVDTTDTTDTTGTASTTLTTDTSGTSGTSGTTGTTGTTSSIDLNTDNGSGITADIVSEVVVSNIGFDNTGVDSTFTGDTSTTSTTGNTSANTASTTDTAGTVGTGTTGAVTTDTSSATGATNTTDFVGGTNVVDTTLNNIATTTGGDTSFDNVAIEKPSIGASTTNTTTENDDVNLINNIMSTSGTAGVEDLIESIPANSAVVTEMPEVVTGEEIVTAGTTTGGLPTTKTTIDSPAITTDTGGLNILSEDETDNLIRNSSNNQTGLVEEGNVGANQILKTITGALAPKIKGALTKALMPTTRTSSPRVTKMPSGLTQVATTRQVPAQLRAIKTPAKKFDISQLRPIAPPKAPPKKVDVSTLTPLTNISGLTSLIQKPTGKG